MNKTGNSGNLCPPLSVDELSMRIRDAVEKDPLMAQVAVRGEIIDFKKHSSGHCYFTLGGMDSRISGVLFKSDLSSVLRWPSAGDDVVVGGRVSIYPQRGIYQLYARRILPMGQGAINRAREEIKNKLTLEGLFDEKRKRPIPPYPSRIACITSPTGAAIRDVIKVTGTRNPSVDLVVIPSAVQGIDAPDQIVKAFSLIPRISAVDLVILVRGGGSREDLTAFDDPDVVRSVASCPVPVIVGVGHQIDFTLVDAAADCRCSTPSEAAEIAVPSAREIKFQIDSLRNRLFSRIRLYVGAENHDLQNLRKNLDQKIGDIFSRNAALLNIIKNNMVFCLKNRLFKESSELSGLLSALRGMSPLSVLKRGFVAVRNQGGRPISSALSLSDGEFVFLDYADGEVLCEVKRVSILERRAKNP